MSEERWLPVVGYEGYYEVSDQGRVRSVARTATDSIGRTYSYPSRILRQFPQAKGHLALRVTNGTRYRTRTVHQLVLETFVGPRPAGLYGCHNDGNPANNRVSNLRWDTPKSNSADMRTHGTVLYLDKTGCPLEHQLVEPNLVAWHAGKGHRGCLACARARATLQARPDLDFKTVANAQYEAIMTGEPIKLQFEDRRDPGVALHTRWHVRRNIVKPDCTYCNVIATG